MEIICYACGKGEFPENTLEGIQNCQAVNADLLIEMDVQLTSDNELVLFHDSTTLRTTGVNHQVEKLTLKELEKLNAGATFYHDRPTRFIKVPTLKEVLHSFPNIRPIIDLSTSKPQVVQALITLIQQIPRHQEFIIVSEHDAILKLCKKALPKNKMAAGSGEVKKLLLSAILKLDRFFPLSSDLLMTPQFYGNIKILSERIIQHVKKRDKKIYVWKEESSVVKLVDTIEEYRKFEKMGIDGIFTSRPAHLYEMVTK